MNPDSTDSGHERGELTRGRLLLIAAAVMWSTSGLFVKSPPLSPLDGTQLAFFRALFAAAGLWPFVNFRRIRWRPLLLVMALTFAAMNLLFITAMTKTSAAATVFLQYTAPVWAFAFGYLVLKEKIHRADLAALGCALVGIGWIVVSDWEGKDFFGNLLAAGSGVCYAGVVLCLRALREEDAAWLVALNHTVSAVVLLPFIADYDFEFGWSQWILLTLFGVIQIALPYVLFARGVRVISASEASLIVLLEPVLNPVWVWIFGLETAPVSTWMGGGFIVGGLALRAVLGRRRA